jgi:Short C-terminal domain
MGLTIEQVNEQAYDIASQSVSDSVVAAARLEQVTMDQQLENFGVGGATRGMAKFGKKLGGAMMPSVGNMSKGLETGFLPKTFILAVTSSQVHAIEEKEKKGRLVPGDVIKSWDRETFRASLGNDAISAVSGAPDDRQILTLYIPLTDSKNKYLKASSDIAARAGSAGQPIRFMIARDEVSNQLAKEVVGDQPAMPNIQIGNMPVQMPQQMPGQMPGQAAPATDSTSQLEKLAQLHASGALTDEEFAAQKAKIIGT